MPQSGNVKLSVYNTIGQRVTTLIDEEVNEGDHHVTFNANTLPAGIYYYQLSTGLSVESKQMLLTR